ncbi:MAG: restriction endonuclease subunit S [Anaerotignum sp.]|nr:restriction endonuclease subunit S [Anaerotignum sp.]
MLKPYDGYKGTDQLWLDSVPKHWDMIKTKYLFSERSSKGFPDEPLLVASQNMGVVPKGVYGNRTVEATKDLHLLKLVKVGDFVISLRSFQGGIEYAYYQGIISPAYTVMIPKSFIAANYFRHLAKSKTFIELLQMCVTGIREGQNVDYNKLKNYRLPVPPRKEQDQIVKYLDWQTAKINTLIKAKKKQIELLKEQKQAVINKAVTKGLDDTVPMKDSGIEWLGEVPEHWEVFLNKRLYMENVRKFEVGETVLSLSQKSGLIPYSEMKERSMHTSTYDNWKLVLPNDLVLNRFKAHLGVLFSSAYKGIVTFHYGVYEPQLPILSQYYELLYHTPAYCCIFAGRSNGMTVGLQNLSNQNFYNVYSVYPPLQEQQAIVTYLEEKTALIDKAIAVIEKEIELVSEYKTSLISSVVTGKVDVRDVVVPDFEVVEDVAEVENDEDEMGG